MNTTKPMPYTITPEHFVRARDDIARRRAQLDAELAQVDADEQAAAHIAGRYSEGDPPPAPQSTKVKAKAPRSGKPYTPDEEAQIEAAPHGDLNQLAEDLGRDYPSVLKHREEQRRKARLKHREEQRRAARKPSPAQSPASTRGLPTASKRGDMEDGDLQPPPPANPDASFFPPEELPGSESAEIFAPAREPDPAAPSPMDTPTTAPATEESVFDAPRVQDVSFSRRTQPPRGRVVHLLGDGPEHPRELDDRYFSSKEPG